MMKPRNLVAIAGTIAWFGASLSAGPAGSSNLLSNASGTWSARARVEVVVAPNGTAAAVSVESRQRSGWAERVFLVRTSLPGALTSAVFNDVAVSYQQGRLVIGGLVLSTDPRNNDVAVVELSGHDVRLPLALDTVRFSVGRFGSLPFEASDDACESGGFGSTECDAPGCGGHDGCSVGCAGGFYACCNGCGRGSTCTCIPIPFGAP